MNLDPINKYVRDFQKEYKIKECKIVRRSN